MKLAVEITLWVAALLAAVVWVAVVHPSLAVGGGVLLFALWVVYRITRPVWRWFDARWVLLPRSDVRMAVDSLMAIPDRLLDYRIPPYGPNEGFMHGATHLEANPHHWEEQNLDTILRERLYHLRLTYCEALKQRASNLALYPAVSPPSVHLGPTFSSGPSAAPGLIETRTLTSAPADTNQALQ